MKSNIVSQYNYITYLKNVTEIRVLQDMNERMIAFANLDVTTTRILDIVYRWKKIGCSAEIICEKLSFTVSKRKIRSVLDKLISYGMIKKEKNVLDPTSKIKRNIYTPTNDLMRIVK